MESFGCRCSAWSCAVVEGAQTLGVGGRGVAIGYGAQSVVVGCSAWSGAVGEVAQSLRAKGGDRGVAIGYGA